MGTSTLRGWGGLAPFIDSWDDSEGPCRVLIGMQRLPDEELRSSLSLVNRPSTVDNQTANRLKEQLAEQLSQQLTFGAPTNADEAALRHLASQLRSGKVVVKLFLKHLLHAKLYLLFRDDKINPIIGYLGSSNLTFSGLEGQGELNVDVVDHDTAKKLSKWFDDRWVDRLCVDVTEELLKIIEESWARESLIPPYHLYLKMAYHLSHEARAGLTEFKIPKVFGDRLFDFQAAAVKIAAHHLNKRNGVLIGDVVGLGKTLMATAVARIMEDDFGLETLIICPKNLVPMWQEYRREYQLRAEVMSLSRVLTELPNLRRYRLIILDESHNLRNREGRRYRAIREYIRENESKCILLSATPYNKTYLDLSNQLRLFVEDDQDLGIRPERLIKDLGEIEFSRQHQANPRTLAAFDFSKHADDWRDLMRLYLVRRTRSFIQDNYAETDPDNGRRVLDLRGRRASPTSQPGSPRRSNSRSTTRIRSDQYASLYSAEVVEKIKALTLARYGLGGYLEDDLTSPPTKAEQAQIDDLSRAGRAADRGSAGPTCSSDWRAADRRSCSRSSATFCATTSSCTPSAMGIHFLSELRTRRCWTRGLPTKTPMRPRGSRSIPTTTISRSTSSRLSRFTQRRHSRARAADVYSEYESRYKSRFKWLRPDLFEADLERHLQRDCDALIGILQAYGDWDPSRDTKLTALHALLTETYPNDKVLVFSQFADTVDYLEEQLSDKGIVWRGGGHGELD